MILLRDEVEIKASPEQVFDWLAHFQENYLAWHPDHVECRFVKGGSVLEVGSVLYIEEYLHGQLHRLKLRCTRVIPNSRVEYKIAPGMGGAFEVEARGDGVLFTADLSFGSGLPGLGWLLDRIAARLFSDRIEVLKQHMAEEGANLKQWLEGVDLSS